MKKHIIQRGISIFGSAVMLTASILFIQCGQNEKAVEKKESPAAVENAVNEEKLSQVTLTARAEERLGVEVSEVKNIDLPGSMALGGEIVAVPGNGSTVSAPMAGTVLKTESGSFPTAGRRLRRGQPILRLLLLPPEKDLLSAKEDVLVKREQLELARSKADRAEKLLATRAISEKALEEAKVELTQAKAALSTAESRLNLLSSTDVDGAASGLTTLVMKSPVNGVLLKLYVAQGQTVPASALLFEVAGLSRVWVKVPVYVGDLSKIDPGSEALVTLMDRSGGDQSYPAAPVQGPPLSDAASVSSSLFFQLDNADGIFRVGQKVGVILTKKGAENSLTLPRSAILYDMYGGTWVYTRISPRVYSRRRVEVGHTVGETAVLTRGVKAGDEVVVAGAAEIFGTEFGVGK